MRWKTAEEVVALREAFAEFDGSIRQFAAMHDEHPATLSRLLRGVSYTDCGGPVIEANSSRRKLLSEVRRARELYSEGRSQPEVAELIGCSVVTVNKMIRGISPYDRFENIARKPGASPVDTSVAQAVRGRYKLGEPVEEIANLFGLSTSSVYRILKSRGPYAVLGHPVSRSSRGRPAALTQKQAKEVRHAHAEGVSQNRLAKKYAVSRGTIRKAIEERGPYSKHDNPG